MYKDLGGLEAILLILNCLQDSVYAKNLMGEFEYVNQKKADNSNTTIEEMLGKTDYDFMSPVEADKSSLDDAAVINTALPILDRVEKITRHDGSEVYVSVTKVPWIIQGETVGVIGVSRDVTIRKEVEEQMLDAVLTEVHALKNVSAFIGGSIQAIISGDIEKTERYLKRVHDSTLRLDRICNDMYYRINAMQGGVKAFRKECDLRQDIIDPALEQLAEKLVENEIIIDDRLGLVPTGYIPVKVDPRLMSEVMIVLFDNAVECAGKKATISYGYENRGDHWHFNVFNDGPPVPAELVPYLFKKHKPKRFKKTGNGWGLYLIHKVIKAHGGRIWYETTKSNHPNFVFTLPKK